MSKPDDNTLETIRALLEYHDSGNGVLLWKIGPKKGELAGSYVGPNKDELRVRINGQYLLGAKIAWYLVFGWWSEYRFRYINQDKTDIRPENIEETERRDGRGR